MVWYKVQNKKPIAYKSGCWDGKKSDPVLVQTKDGRFVVAEMYEGVLDGNEFCEFYDGDFEVKGVSCWTHIYEP
jgi:hypothetical protein